MASNQIHKSFVGQRELKLSSGEYDFRPKLRENERNWTGARPLRQPWIRQWSRSSSAISLSGVQRMLRSG